MLILHSIAEILVELCIIVGSLTFLVLVGFTLKDLLGAFFPFRK